jgi:hypothetical protein
MSPVLTATPETGLAPPQKPSRWQVGWTTFAGYLLSGLLLLVVGFATSLAIGWPNAPGRGVFYRYDAWSWAAEACVGLLITFITAWLVADRLRSATGWEVPLGFTFVTLLVTGYAPALALTPFYWAAAPVSLVAATLILHRRCEPGGAEPMRMLGRLPRRRRQAAAIALALAGPLMFAYVLGYAATHPLANRGDIGARPWERHPGNLHRYRLTLDNMGTAEVSDIAIVRVDGTPALQLERAGAPPLLSLKRVTIAGEDSYSNIELELRQGGVCPEPLAELDAVWIRYTVRGMRHEQRVPLADPPAVRCGPASGR